MTVVLPLADKAEAACRAALAAAGPEGERHALLRMGLTTLAGLEEQPLPAACKALWCGFLLQLAQPRPQWLPQFEPGHWRLEELAQLVALRRFPAGQHDCEISGFPKPWLLKVNPLHLPALLAELRAMGGFKPLAKVHLNPWRANPLVTELEWCRSCHRVARAVALRPEIRGLMGSSWFYAPQVGEFTPHLAWPRRFFVENGATLVEMEHAAEDAGFLTGSAKRRQAYDEGRFHPRVTAVLWRRRHLLDWAERHPEFSDET